MFQISKSFRCQGKVDARRVLREYRVLTLAGLLLIAALILDFTHSISALLALF